MYEYDLVRRLHHHEGLSRHEIARRTGLHRQPITKMLRYSRSPGCESLNNVTPADACHGRTTSILAQREKAKRQTIIRRRIEYRKTIVLLQRMS